MFPDFREVVHNHNPVGLNKIARSQKDPKKMKLGKLTNVILFGLLLTIPAVGCKKKTLGVTPLPGPYGQMAGSTPGKSLIDDGNKLSSEQLGSTAAADSNKTTDAELWKSRQRHRDIYT